MTVIENTLPYFDTGLIVKFCITLCSKIQFLNYHRSGNWGTTFIVS